MLESVWFEPVILASASQIRQSGISLTSSQTIGGIRQALRQILELCSHQVWMAGTDEQTLRQPESIQAVFGFQMIDPPARRAALHLNVGADGLTPGILQAILRKAFLELEIFRLELTAPSAANWLNVLHGAGLKAEGCLRSCIFETEMNRHHDVMLYSILRPEFSETATAFIPFRFGLVAVSGNGQAINTAEFARYGHIFNSVREQESAEMLGLLDFKGCVLPRGELEGKMAGQLFLVRPDAPAPVFAAAAQIAEYIAGKRMQFDLPLDVSQGSDFQQKVWMALASIPYGSTVTYEELAFKLEPGNWEQARRSARAIGSACGANPLPLILPCHRVIGKNGRLVGFSGGLDIKEYLLDHEIMGVL